MNVKALVSSVCSWCQRGYGVEVEVGDQGRVEASIPHPDPLRGERGVVDSEGRVSFVKDAGFLCPECEEICAGLEEKAMEAYFNVYVEAAGRQRSRHRLQRDVRMREIERQAIAEEG